MLNWTMSNTKVLNKWLSYTNVNDLTSTPPPTTIIILVVKRLMFVFLLLLQRKSCNSERPMFWVLQRESFKGPLLDIPDGW